MYGPNLIRVAALLILTMTVIAPAHVQFAAGAVQTSEVPASKEPLQRVLVLRDGGVLTGQISQSADRYVVVSNGAEISVPAANVAFVSRTLDEAYEHQRRAMQQPTAEAHLNLADWCLRCRLYPQAAQELLAARGLEPRHPKLALLERRLAVIGRPSPQRSTAVVAADSQPVPTNESDERRTLTEELPAGAVERFTRKVQPLLVNNCTTAGCHRAGGPQSFELDRALLHGMSNRRSTTHNLAAVLEIVDRERPQESQLLTIPRRDHGGMNRPIFGPRQSQQFQQLVEWVAMVTNSAAGGEDVPSADDGQAGDPPSESESPPVRWREPVMRVTYDADGKVRVPIPSKRLAATKSADSAAADFDDAALPPFTPSQLRYGAKVQPWQPKDPFDPEIFNRQSAKQKPNTSPQN